MSGSYKGALFSASSYDADDGMFLLAYDLFSSKNYEDWLWFLEKLKMVIGERDVIILSDRHQGIIRSVSEGGNEGKMLCKCLILSPMLAIRRMGFDVSDYVDDWYKYNLQEKIYSGSMRILVTHDMPMIDEDGTVRDALGHTYPFLNPPTTKRPPGRPRKR
ncbi:hypothetical protein CK203_082530 [Vitis vinifera]|uniref:MULE transposase domain-containing protein n=1 Tax=Vitis vinifera TaxID=29760 RepID=A0A438DK01_VITVI|nr:hypothetical protein CK203_082530 [Vitis vinifera]